MKFCYLNEIDDGHVCDLPYYNHYMSYNSSIAPVVVSALLYI